MKRVNIISLSSYCTMLPVKMLLITAMLLSAQLSSIFRLPFLVDSKLLSLYSCMRFTAPVATFPVYLVVSCYHVYKYNFIVGAPNYAFLVAVLDCSFCSISASHLRNNMPMFFTSATSSVKILLIMMSLLT